MDLGDLRIDLLGPGIVVTAVVSEGSSCLLQLFTP